MPGCGPLCRPQRRPSAGTLPLGLRRLGSPLLTSLQPCGAGVPPIPQRGSRGPSPSALAPCLRAPLSPSCGLSTRELLRASPHPDHRMSSCGNCWEGRWLPRKLPSNKDCRAGSGGRGELLAPLSLFPAEWLLATYTSAPPPGTRVLCHSFCRECFSFSPCPDGVQAPRPARMGPLSCLPLAPGWRGAGCKDRLIAVPHNPGHPCPPRVQAQEGCCVQWPSSKMG